jgi:hypothetical protein
VLYATMHSGLFHIIQSRQYYLLCRDSLSALKSLQVHTPHHPLFWRFCIKCSTPIRHKSLLHFVGYLTTQVC